MRRPVYCSTVTVTILASGEYRRDYAAGQGGEGTSAATTVGEGLDMLALDTNGGPSLGVLAQSPWELVPDNEVEAMCQAMGNDASFFDVDEEALRLFEELEAEVDRQIEATRRRGLMHAVRDGGFVGGPKEGDEG